MSHADSQTDGPAKDHWPGAETLDGAGVLSDAPGSPDLSWRHDLRMLLLIAGPNVASTVAQTLMSFVDYAIVSQLPDPSAAQAAVSSSGMVFFSVFSLLLGVMVCVTTVVSQSFGANRPRDCSAYAWQGIWISMLFGVGALALWPATPTLYDFIGHDPKVRLMEVRYTQIRWVSLGAAGATVALANFFNGIHRPKVNAVSVIAATVLNAILTYTLVLGRWGLPAMGVTGAAWGTVTATLFRTTWLLAAMCFGRHAAPFHALRTWRVNADKMRRLVRVGWPSGVSFVLDIAAWSVLLVFIVGKFGTVHLAATATVFRYLEMSFMPAVGIGIAVSTVVGRAIGEGRPHLARRRAALGSAINMIYMGVMGVIYVVFGPGLIWIFNGDAAVITLGAELLAFAAVFQLFDAVGITYSNALRGAGDTRWPMVVGTIEVWAIMICGSLWVIRAHPELGSKGPWIFATAFIIVIGTTFWVRWRRGKWEQIDVIGRTEPDAADFEIAPSEPAVAEAAGSPEVAAEPEHVGRGSK